MRLRAQARRRRVALVAALALAVLYVPAGSGRTLSAPAVTGISPSSGTDCGGTQVTVAGSGFTGATAVDFGTAGQPAQSFTVLSDTQITAVSPAGVSMVDVRVTTPGGTSPTVSADLFIYTGNSMAPCVTGVSPSSGPGAGGTSVTVTGTNFTGATAVDFGSTAAAIFSVDSSTQITVPSSPAGAGTVDVTVTNPNGTSPAGSADRFAYAPTVTGVTPNGGPAAGGTSVTIAGTGFTGATAVEFGSAPAASFTVDSSTQISAVSPAGSGGTVDVTVTASGLTSATGNGDLFTFTVPAAPTVSVVFPNSGSTAGGTTVRLTGVALTGATAVDFGATAATSFSVDSDTQITAVSPAGVAGTVGVTVTGPGGTSTVNLLDHFTYQAPAPPPPTPLPPPAPPPPLATTPLITLQPADQIVHAGAAATFAATAAGTPFPTVQWQRSSDGGTSWGDLAGANSTTLTLTAQAADGGDRFRAVFSNSAGTATSRAALLTVISPPDLALKMLYTGSFAPGGSGAYRLYVTNVGGGPTTGPIVVKDSLPAEERLLRVAAGAAWSCTRQIVCTAQRPLAAGASLPQIAIDVQLLATRGRRLTNLAIVNTPGDADPGNDTASFTLTVGGTEISVGESIAVGDSPTVSPPVVLPIDEPIAINDSPQLLLLSLLGVA